jgi:hypothetical protein
MDQATALQELERATDALHAASKAVLRLARSNERTAAAKAADPDEWTRLPAGTRRCPVSGWSRSTIIRRANEGHIRRKTVDGCTFYAAADVRRHISAP